MKIGVLHPVTGALAYSGQQCRLGALLAIEDINQAGGIKSLGGAPLEAVLGDAQSRPEAASAEVEKMAAAGVSAVVGATPRRSAWRPRRPPSATAAPCGRRGRGRPDRRARAEEHLRFGRAIGRTERAIQDLAALNQAAGKPARTVMIVHEDSLFGAGTAALLSKSLPGHGFEVKEVIKHPEPDARFQQHRCACARSIRTSRDSGQLLQRIRALLRAMKQQKVQPKAIYPCWRGGVELQVPKEYPDVAHGIIDCNHWFNPKDARVAPLKARVEQKGAYFSYEVFMTYTSMFLLADALERANRPTAPRSSRRWRPARSPTI